MATRFFFIIVEENVVPCHGAQKKGLERAVDQHEGNAEQ